MEKIPSKWISYYENTKDRAPNVSLVESLEYVKERATALDLGAGALRDTRYLLDSGFHKVIALDSEIINEENQISDERLVVIRSTFESLQLNENAFDLINAQFSLPFTVPESFVTMFEKVRASIKPDGIFVGQLFGVNDGWCKNTKMTFHTLEEVCKLLSGMEILKLDEVERDGLLTSGASKHWHFFQILARKL